MRLRLLPGLFLVAKYLVLVGDIWHYNRKYPVDLLDRFGGKVRKKVSLKTRDPLVAARKASKMAAEDDALWQAMRTNRDLPDLKVRKAARALIADQQPTEWKEPHPYIPGQFAVWSKAQVLDELLEGHPLHRTPIQAEARRILEGGQSIPFLSEALEVYLQEHKRRGSKELEKTTRLGVELVKSGLGDRPLDLYRREEITEWRDSLLTEMTTGTFKRRLGSIKAVFNKACAEFQLDLVNPFEKLTIHGEGLDSKERPPFTYDELLTIRSEVRSKDDSIGWIVGLLVETGARCGEIVGLRSDDVVLSHAVPHLLIRPHPKLGRTLKNKQSERTVPLVGVSLWAAERALRASPRGWLFPRYAADHNIRATSAENTINKWLKKMTGKTTHSFRHGLLDRLRDSGCPEDAAKQMVGHGAMTITRGYGRGYSLEVLEGYLGAAKLPEV